MLAKNKNNGLIIYTWDCCECPNFAKLYREITGFQSPVFDEVNTRSDALCVIVSTDDITFDINAAYKSFYNDSYDENGEWKIIE